MSVSCEGCVLSGTCLCIGLIIRPEDSYRVWCVSECDRGTSQRSTGPLGLSSHGKKSDKIILLTTHRLLATAWESVGSIYISASLMFLQSRHPCISALKQSLTL